MRPGWVAVLAAAALYLAFFPKGPVNADEYHYAGQAYALAHGRFLPAVGDPLPVVRGEEGAAVRFPAGWPLALSVARLLGFRAMYLLPMFFHLAAGAAFSRLMVRRGLPAWANVVYLFHPALWGLSRTIMSDVPAVALLIVAVDAWEAGRSWLPGALLAYGMLMRMGALFTGAGFALAVLGDLRREPRRLAGLAFPAVLAAATHVVLNRMAADHPLSSPYVQGALPLLDGSRIGEHLLLYAAGLAVLPPSPLAAFLLRAREADRWCLGALPVLAFFVPFAYHDASPSFLETLVGGQRLVLAAHVFLVIGTSRTWGSLATAQMRPLIVGGALAMAVLAALALDRIRAPYERVAQAVSACRPERIGHDYGSGRVVAGLAASRWRYLDGSDPRGQDDVVVIARSLVSNRLPDAEPWFSYPELEPYRHLCRSVGRFEVYDLAGRCGAIGNPCGR
jgi:hypothetical protein